MPANSAYNQELARLFTRVGQDDFAEQLVITLKSLVPVDDATILVYPDKALPIIEYFEVPETMATSTLDMFVAGAFMLDPYYQAASRDRRFGVFRLRDLAPAGFRDSEYYKTWYKRCGYQDECGFLLPNGDQGFINIALGRTRPRNKFSPQQVAALASIQPVIAVLCQQHWQTMPTQGAVNLRAQLHTALQEFGSSLLTEREAQVINLVLHGHSTKTLAEKLSISVETVKLHRKHAYAKLEVGSQAELFYLFLDSLMSAGDYAGGDTLVAYLQPPPRPCL
ncbi:helix-turn-helix transcriptional regulator [Kineobactrum sediminis]|uniref:Helix-turn-helix transcriptional regulator n=1 Tax=Kineobactrum sediminis TaxID=1905677 RepID=A0A2N5Y5K6_9GAMM|nr:helix-turn-helix transcriptional regulator [Kineobactrum sediminis]PLW83680.1 helix-turn-helix transcriptional regulator [Kineobactrum sediminis]